MSSRYDVFASTVKGFYKISPRRSVRRIRDRISGEDGEIHPAMSSGDDGAPAPFVKPLHSTCKKRGG